MALSASEKERVIDWIRSHCAQLRCGCDAMGWNLEPELAFSLMADSQSGRINYLSGYPLVVLTCDNCGRTLFFNAIKLGVWHP